MKKTYRGTTEINRVYVARGSKPALQKEMFRLLLRTLSVKWAHDEVLIRKIEKLSYILAGYTTDELNAAVG